MKRPNKKSQVRPWRALLFKSRAQSLGIVYAADRKGAEAAAIKEFALTEEQQKRLVIEEQA
jgi:hypothetical protein